MARVTGIGGIFFRVADPAATVAWYRDNLGIESESGFPGAMLHATGGEVMVWAAFADDTDYFGDPDQQLMVNYRVDDLDGMLERLRAGGVHVLDDRMDDDNGRFAWAIDCDGRRFELWQPAPGH